MIQKKKISKNLSQLLLMLLAICGGILFYYLLFKKSDISIFFEKAYAILSPFLYGLVVAYLLNPIMIFFERKLSDPVWRKDKKPITDKGQKIVKISSLVLTMMVFFLAVYLLLMLIIPQLVTSIQSIVERFPSYMAKTGVWLNNFMQSNPEIMNIINQNWENVSGWLTDTLLPYVQSIAADISPNILGGVVSVVSTLFDLIIGIIVAVYVLNSKKTLCAQAKKITYSLFSEDRANAIINNVRFANKTFGGFLSGKILDSLIIGIICFICCAILKIPYPLLISVIIGVTNIIPFFGPIIGAVPCALLLIMISPIKCLVFIIFILILQQFDGNILGPKILGNSTGLSALWVLFAITLFGGIMGVFGMVIGVPLFAVLYAAIKTHTEKRLSLKNMPVETEFYQEYDYHSKENIHNSGREFRLTDNKSTNNK